MSDTATTLNLEFDDFIAKDVLEDDYLNVAGQIYRVTRASSYEQTGMTVLIADSVEPHASKYDHLRLSIRSNTHLQVGNQNNSR